MELTVKERPILFSGAMVRAILDGDKWKTRRVVKWPDTPEWHDGDYDANYCVQEDGRWWPWACTRDGRKRDVDWPLKCPYGVPGDRLWVRETWQHADWTEDGQPWVRYAADDSVRFCEGAGEDESLVDRWAELSDPTNFAIDGKAADRKWRPSIFMPRWASRLTLTITDVRVERLQEISEEDAKAEGVGAWESSGGDGYLKQRPARDSFTALWDAINGKRAPWESNPWVWVIGFEVVR